MGEACSNEWAPEHAELKKTCSQTKTQTAPQRSIVIVGNSHSDQIRGSLLPIAEGHNWRLLSLLKQGCTYGESVSGDKRGSDCRKFNELVTAYILDKKPDAVFLYSTVTGDGNAKEVLAPGIVETIEKLRSAGIEVIGLRDNPRFGFDVPQCVASKSAAECGLPRASVLGDTDPAQALAGKQGVHLIDLSDRFCIEGECPPVIGNVLVYLDDNHLTWEYAKSLAPDLEERLLAATKWTS